MSHIHRIIGLKKSTETIQNIYFQKQKTVVKFAIRWLHID